MNFCYRENEGIFISAGFAFIVSVVANLVFCCKNWKRDIKTNNIKMNMREIEMIKINKPLEQQNVIISISEPVEKYGSKSLPDWVHAEYNKKVSD